MISCKLKKFQNKIGGAADTVVYTVRRLNHIGARLFASCTVGVLISLLDKVRTCSLFFQCTFGSAMFVDRGESFVFCCLVIYQFSGAFCIVVVICLQMIQRIKIVLVHHSHLEKPFFY